MIDLADMYDVKVDSDLRRAHTQGGALLGHLDTAALKHGLVTTAGVVSHTGVGGFTLGGGFGRLNRKHGLAVDNVVAADIVEVAPIPHQQVSEFTAARVAAKLLGAVFDAGR